MPDAKILLVEDDSQSRFYYRRILTSQGYNVTISTDGNDALKVLREQSFDLVITDWLMPELDGIELTKRIRFESEIQPIIIVLTAVNLEEARKRALFAGADEYVAKPVDKYELFNLIEATLHRKSMGVKPFNIPEKSIETSQPFYGIGIVASTGGPFTVSTFLTHLDVTLNAAYFLVQHGQEWMLKTFVKSLQEKTSLPIHLAENEMKIRPKNIYLAPGERHMVINDDFLTIKLLDTEPVNYVKPSADPLFESIAKKFGNKSVGVVLTGMGRDGTLGAGYISAANGKVIIQDPSTAILPSMPESVMNLNLADRVCNVKEIPKLLYHLIN